MTHQDIIKQQVERFDEIFKCINLGCNGEGTVAVMRSDGEMEAEQCQYCFTVRFPARDFLTTAMTAAAEATEKAGEVAPQASMTHFTESNTVQCDEWNDAIAQSRRQLDKHFGRV